MPCKTCKKSKNGETRSKTNDFKSKLRVSWKPVNPQECAWKNLYLNYHEDHIAGRGDNSLQHYSMVHKFIPMPQAMEIPAAKAAVDRIGETWQDSGVGLDKSQKQIRGARWSKDEGQKSSFCLTDGQLSFEECRPGDKAPKIPRSSCTPKWHCERWFWILCSIYRTRIISISNDGSKSHGGAQDKQRMQYLLLPRSKWKMFQNDWKFPNRNVQTFGFVYNDTIGQNHGPVWKTQSFLLNEICMVILWQDCYEKGNLRKSFLKYGWEKGSNWECLFVHREKRVILICVCGWHLIGWKETKH